MEDVAAKQHHALTIGPFGSDLKTSDYTEAGIPIVFVRDVQPNCFRAKQRKYVSVRKAQELFTGRIAAVEKLKTAHRRSLTEIDALFACLQHRAFRGEL
jgi:type I restriction enzyme S subunit